MLRFENSPGLFGVGIGGSTLSDIKCEWCGTVYDGRELEDGEPRSSSESIGVVYFGSLLVLECCYAKVEAAVLAHIIDIIPWYMRILTSRERRHYQEQEQIVALATAVSAAAREPLPGGGTA